MSRSETWTLPRAGSQRYGRITNPSKVFTMIATLRSPGWFTRVHEIAPCEALPVHASGPESWDDAGVVWPFWTLEWKELPKRRKGLMRFSR